MMGPMATEKHDLLIRVLSPERETLFEDDDFTELAVHDWFETVMDDCLPGEIVQIVATDTNEVSYERTKE